MRDAVVDFVRSWSDRTEVPTIRFIEWLEIAEGKFYEWRKRYGKANEHNAWVPRDHWLEEWEKEAIRNFHAEHPLEGYRRLTYMMMDRDVAHASPSSVYRVLSSAGLLGRWRGGPTGKGGGFKQPAGPHEHWHTDVSYLNIRGTFYYFCGVLDGYSRALVHWEIRERMTEKDIEIVLQRARERHPEAKPRVISDNGPQFIARDFKEFVRAAGLTHVRTSPHYPQSNGKMERWHKTLKGECIRVKTPLTLEDARRVTADFVRHYNEARLHSAIGYVTPKDKLEGRAEAIHAERDRKLEEARQRRGERRRQRRAEAQKRVAARAAEGVTCPSA